MTDPRSIEPPADLRTGAKQLRQLFIALINEDFSKSEALAIIGHVIAAGHKGEEQ